MLSPLQRRLRRIIDTIPERLMSHWPEGVL